MASGTMAFGTTPFGLTSPDSYTEERGQVTASRSIDINGRFVQTNSGKGDFVGWTDIQQRVFILLARFVEEPDRIGPNFGQDLRLQIENALRPLTRGPNAVVAIDEIRIDDFGSSYTKRTLRFRDLTNGEIRAVPIGRRQ